MSRESYIQGLKDAVEFLEKHPEVPVVGPLFYMCISSYLLPDNFSKSDVIATARALGKTNKNYCGSTFSITSQVTENFKYTLSTGRELVCEKKIVMVKKPFEPEWVVPAKPEREEEEEQWVCNEPLLAPEKEADDAGL